ncbi:MAG: hypothetical protein L3J83_09195 [Proteobacteria bacterium]|nr:hypothetical protein [Pseudomonadota bacterium]
MTRIQQINTLHICNYSEVQDKSFYAGLVDSNDCIIVYSRNMNNKQHQELLKLLIGKCKNIYFIIEDNQHNIATICHKQWLQFTNQSKRTLTWK